jgi:hypothetical protein
MDQRLLDVRNSLMSMVEDPMHGFGVEVTDHGYDMVSDAADFVFPLDGHRYEIEIRELS